MDVLNLFWDLVSDYTLRTVALGSATVGIVSGALGAFAVLRKQSLLGDTISHTALPGIALAFLLTLSKASLVLILGAAIAGWIGTLIVTGIIRHTRIKSDSALGMVLSVFFGFGLVLLTFIQKIPEAGQAGLDNFLFGQASALLQKELILMAIIGAFTLLMLNVFWKEFKILSFDPDFGASMGFRMRFIDILLTSLLVVAIVLGLQMVGVVLMSAMVVGPASAARQWTDRLGAMVVLSGLFGALAGISGALISGAMIRMPTGPTIVICLSVIVLISLFFAPNRGLFWRWYREQRNLRRLHTETVLNNLYQLALQHDDLSHPHSILTLDSMTLGYGSVIGILRELETLGWVHPVSEKEWALTDSGVVEAKRLCEKLENNS